ncbi:hypothetical protein [Tateyamaria sp. ANG-S1]|uniref:hypothetical protein n=1 Tax=Tateyamaria sp. ANG-S1 TaxID=1577905 RepID=UPI0005839A5B|nr:hypothetical protein [Tateyamaria sp. ANG-S1]KIC49749.1 hypothetical protein RA29_08850 [Tateyamaria sp. ANG-S1]
MTQPMATVQHARALYRAHGDKAEAHAAQNARAASDAGNSAEAEDWRKIRATIRQLRGANQT